MKNILSSLNESEKKRILEMHYRASGRQYLMEQPATQKTGVETDSDFPVDQGIFTNLGISWRKDHPYKLKLSFNFDTGEATTTFYHSDPVGTSSTWTQKSKCKCGTPSGVESVSGKIRHTWGFSQREDLEKTLGNEKSLLWIKERCKVYLQQTDPNCNTNDYVESAIPNEEETTFANLYTTIESAGNKNPEDMSVIQKDIEKLKSLGFDTVESAKKRLDELNTKRDDPNADDLTSEEDEQRSKLIYALLPIENYENSSKNAGPSQKDLGAMKGYAAKYVCNFIKNSKRYNNNGLISIKNSANKILNDPRFYPTPPQNLESMSFEQKIDLFCQGR